MTTHTVPSKKSPAVYEIEIFERFPIKIPTSSDTIEGGATRQVKDFWDAVVEEDANAVLGPRSGPDISRIGDPRMFLQGITKLSAKDGYLRESGNRDTTCGGCSWDASKQSAVERIASYTRRREAAVS